MLNHSDNYYRVRGPLNIPRPPQGYPVIFQAGISEAGRDLAAATAEGVFSGELTVERSRAHYADIKGRMARYGRSPDHMKILPGCTVVCGKSEAEAKDKEDYLASLIHPLVGREYIATLTRMDLTDCSPDDPLPDRPGREASGIADSVRALASREGLTIRQLYERLAGSHGKLTLRGTPARIADQMQEWFDNRACDGFILQPSFMPGDLDDVVDLLVPELQHRGLTRVGYAGKTLRDNLGLQRPPSRYSVPVAVRNAQGA
jgi:alkanesulfonate monooxygenase SsuD/methylene tetrahydromethanopterin reductase-like flavin-dependent oxidoreductase (luciferase family)